MKFKDYANLTDEQTDNLLRYAGPAMYAQGIMDSTIVIENRKDLAAYADGLGRFYRLSKTEKHAVAGPEKSSQKRQRQRKRIVRQTKQVRCSARDHDPRKA